MFLSHKTDSNLDSKTHDFIRIGVNTNEQKHHHLSVMLPWNLPQRRAFPQLGGVPHPTHARRRNADVYLREIGSSLFKMLDHTFQREFGGIVRATEMGEPEPAHAISTPGF